MDAKSNKLTLEAKYIKRALLPLQPGSGNYSTQVNGSDTLRSFYSTLWYAVDWHRL